MNLTSHTESVLASVNCRYTSATRNEVNPTEPGLSVPPKIRIVYTYNYFRAVSSLSLAMQEHPSRVGWLVARG